MKPSIAWLAAAAVLLSFPLGSRVRHPPAALFPRTATPFDGSNPETARQWLFLRQAREAVPPRATYTVTASSRDAEMNIFMMSLGLLPDAIGLPTSYYGVPATAGADARYVLSYRSGAPETGARVRMSLPDGTVYERPDRPR